MVCGNSCRSNMINILPCLIRYLLQFDSSCLQTTPRSSMGGGQQCTNVQRFNKTCLFHVNSELSCNNIPPARKRGPNVATNWLSVYQPRQKMSKSSSTVCVCRREYNASCYYAPLCPISYHIIFYNHILQWGTYYSIIQKNHFCKRGWYHQKLLKL